LSQAENHQELAEKLQKLGVAQSYHAGLDNAIRKHKMNLSTMIAKWFVQP
jgi:superfamily II helicase